MACRNSAAPERQPDAQRDAFSERLTPENLVQLLSSKRNGVQPLTLWPSGTHCGKAPSLSRNACTAGKPKTQPDQDTYVCIY